MQALRAILRVWQQALGRPGRQRSVPAAAPGGEVAGMLALQAGLELATQGIVLVGSGGNIVAVNSQAKSLIHSSHSSLPGLDFWEALPEAVSENHRGACAQAMRDGGEHAFVVHDALADRWIEYKLRRQPPGMVVNLRDVSDTRQALLLLQGCEFCNQSLFEGNTQAMWLFDADSRRILAVNRAAAVFYGMPAVMPTPMPVFEVFFPAGEGALWLERLQASDFQQQMQVCAQRRLNGERVLVELACSTVQWFEQPAVLVSVVDVGARHFADTELHRLNDVLEGRIARCSMELRHSREELDTFTHAMSDDLKAPLHAVNGFAAALTERHSAALDEQGRHYLARIRAGTRQMAKLIDDLRTLAHLPGVDLSPALVDLAPACRRLIEDWRKREPQRQLVLEIPPALLVLGDRNLLLTAVACLLENAWKFTSKKEQGWIQVGLVPGEAGHTVLMVADNGAGFDVTYVDKLFTAFQRLHSAADFAGGGLGLAIVRRVAERHGGTVWATTTGHAGASFFMSVPALADDATLPPVVAPGASY